MGQHRDLGIDLVAMCAMISLHKVPCLYFSLITLQLVSSISQPRPALLKVSQMAALKRVAPYWGETAEMQVSIRQVGMILQAFVLAQQKEDSYCQQKIVKDGDLVLALPSSGIHANGFSRAQSYF